MGRPWRRLRWWMAAALVVLAVLGLYVRHGSGAVGDAHYSYLMVSSALEDGDLRLENQLREFGNRWRYRPDPETGYIRMRYEPWPFLFWPPSYLVSDQALKVGKMLGAKVDARPKSRLHQKVTLAVTPIVTMIGVWLLYRAGRRLTGRRAAMLGAASVALCSHLPFYALFNPGYAHAYSFATVALLLERWLALRRRRSWRAWGVVGACAGLVMLVRPQDGLLALLPACDLLTTALRQPRARRVGVALSWCSAFGLVALAVFSPTLWLFNLVYGGPFTTFQGPVFMRWSEPWLLGSWFFAASGLFVWAPVCWLGVIGWVLLLLRRRLRWLGIGFFVVFIAGSYVNACAWDWWGSDSYGARRYMGLLPTIGLGQAFLFRRLAEVVRLHPRRSFMWATSSAILFVFIIHLSAMSAVRHYRFRSFEPHTLSDRLEGLGKELGADMEGWVGDPLSWPANLWFAARHGVSPDRYSCVVGRHFLSFSYKSLTFDRNSEVLAVAKSKDRCLLGFGFGTVQEEGGKSYRTVEAGLARVLLPIFLPTDATLTFVARGGSDCSVSVDLDGQPVGNFNPGERFEHHTLALPKSLLDSGVLDLDLATAPAGCLELSAIHVTPLRRRLARQEVIGSGAP